MLFAAGGSGNALRQSPATSLDTRGVTVVVIAVCLIFCPARLPVFLGQNRAYMQALGLNVTRTETSMKGILPQYFADEFDGKRWSEGRPGLQRASRGGTPKRPDPCRKLWRERERSTSSRCALRFAQIHLRSSKLLLWGPRDYTGERVILLENGA